MPPERNMFILVDTSSRMYLKSKKNKTAMDKIYKFLLTLAKKGDQQPGYFHRVQLYIGDKQIKLDKGKAQECIESAQKLILEEGGQVYKEDFWRNLLEENKSENSQFFILSSVVVKETLQNFRAYKKNLMFLDFCGKKLKLPEHLKKQVQLIKSKNIVKSAKLIHRQYLRDLLVTVNFGWKMSAEFITAYNEEVDLKTIDVIGSTTYEPAESVEILARGFILPIDECYDRTGDQITNPTKYQVLKLLLGDEEAMKDCLPDPSSSRKRKIDQEKGEKDPVPVKRGSVQGIGGQEEAEKPGTSGEIKKMEETSETQSTPMWLFARALDRETDTYRPVILRLRGLTQTDKTYHDPETLKKKLAEEAEKQKQEVATQESPASPEGPASPDQAPVTSSQPVKIIPTDVDYRGAAPVKKAEDIDYRFRGPKISPAKAETADEVMSEDEDDGELGELVDEIIGSDDDEPENVIPQEMAEEEKPKEVELKWEDMDDGKYVEVVVLNMTWDDFLHQAVTVGDDEAMEEVTEREKTVVGEEPFQDYTNLTGWYTDEQMVFYVNKMFRALRKINERPQLYETEYKNLTDMVVYGQNYDLAKKFSKLMVDDLEAYPEEAEPLARKASKHFENLYYKLAPHKPKRPAKKPDQHREAHRESHQSRSGYQGIQAQRGRTGFQSYRDGPPRREGHPRDQDPPEDQRPSRDQGHPREQEPPRNQEPPRGWNSPRDQESPRGRLSFPGQGPPRAHEPPRHQGPPPRDQEMFRAPAAFQGGPPRDFGPPRGQGHFRGQSRGQGYHRGHATFVHQGPPRGDQGFPRDQGYQQNPGPSRAQEPPRAQGSPSDPRLRGSTEHFRFPPPPLGHRGGYQENWRN
ncbi:unnamed protein product [Caenorhabditis brenneri]